MLRVMCLLLGTLGAGLPAALQAAESTSLGDVQKVYFWSMRYAFDQYLAEQITTVGLYDVVIDPKFADAVLTDRIDSKFLEGMDELFPLPEGEEGTEGETKSKDPPASGSIETDFRVQRPANRSTSRAQGTLFLVDVESRRVLWSTYLKEFDPSPNKLHKQAEEVIERLGKSLQPAQQ
jgi:hypothetical protein